MFTGLNTQGPFTFEALPPDQISFVPLKQTKEFKANDLMQVCPDLLRGKGALIWWGTFRQETREDYNVERGPFSLVVLFLLL